MAEVMLEHRHDQHYDTSSPCYIMTHHHQATATTATTIINHVTTIKISFAAVKPMREAVCSAQTA